MCLTLFTHYCSAEHETRPRCTLNPATGCTVFNPYADPGRKPCPTPCNSSSRNSSMSMRGAAAATVCPWHGGGGGCCRLVRTRMCGAFDPSQCPNDVQYHLRREPTAAAAEEYCESEEVDLIRPPESSSSDLLLAPLPLPNEEPWFVALRWDFFQAGTDLCSLGARRAQYAAALDRTTTTARGGLLLSNGGGGGGGGEEGEGEGEEVAKETVLLRGYYEATDRKYQTVELYLGQLAHVWDRNAAYGLCPPRPGRWPDPDLAWPGYARVDPDLGVWSIGYELQVRTGEEEEEEETPHPEVVVVRPPARQRLFETHHVPPRLRGGGSGGGGGDLTSAAPLPMSSVYPRPPSSPSPSPSPPPYSQEDDVSRGDQARLEQYLAQKDERITRYIQRTGMPQEIFARYLQINNNNDDKIPEWRDRGRKQRRRRRRRRQRQDPVTRDRVAAARNEVLLSPRSSTMLLMPRSAGQVEMRTVEAF